ncbi:MAG: hypothetical protein QOI66_3997 [Myxococcales bacterium]|nr:hypothetical protein [Myxococcales bacterium]
MNTAAVIARSSRSPSLAGVAAFVVAAAALAAAGCGTTKTIGGKGRELVLAYDDSHSTGTVAFPSQTYESITRFELPAGEHRPLRLRLQAEAPGSLEITIYDSTPLETPGEAILSITRELDKQDLSDGRDGRWVVEDLMEAKPLKGVVWVGIRKSAGQPTLWSSAVSSGQCYIRNNDPNNLLGLLPTKRTPMVRLEVAP